MKIIAKSSDGYLIEASQVEVRNITDAVYGPKTIGDIKIGLQIPGIDYAATVAKLENLITSYEFDCLQNRIASFNKSYEELTEALTLIHEKEKKRCLKNVSLSNL